MSGIGRNETVPTRAQHARLADYLAHTRHLYNAVLEERIGCYPKTGRTISNTEQSRGLTELRAGMNRWLAVFQPWLWSCVRARGDD